MQHVRGPDRQVLIEESRRIIRIEKEVEEDVLEAMELKRRAQEMWERVAFLRTTQSRILNWMVNNNLDEAFEEARKTFIGETEGNPIDVEEFQIE